MSFIGSQDQFNPDDPDDPLYYAPRSMRSEANLRSDSTPQTRSVRTTSSRSKFDEMREEAFAKSTRHPLESEFVYERDRPRTLLGVAGRFAAAIGVFAIVVFLFFLVVPKSQGSDSAEHAVSEFRTLASSGAAKVTPEESQALLQKFVRWQQRQ